MRGLFLQGGGAKGAFQAGVIYGLYEEKIRFDIISGTSIGAVNSYYIYTNNLEKMKILWQNIEESNVDSSKISGDVIENKDMIEKLINLQGENENIKSIYVNYIRIDGNRISEKVVDILKLNKEDKINAIKYSSLLPYGMKNEVSMEELCEKIDTKKIFDKFKIDLQNGKYDGYNLDGGIINNNLLSPFIKNKVDKLYIISLMNNYEIPEYILDYYDRKNIIVIEPKTQINMNDTFRFKKDFCLKLFNEGYKISKNISQ